MVAAMTTDDARAILAQACKDAGGQKIWADQHGLSPQYVNDILKYRNVPGDKILAALGLRWTIERVG